VSARWARPWFAVTAICAAAGIALSAYTAVQTPGHFHSAVARGFNTFAFLTVLSNLIVGATTLLLAIKPDLKSAIFRAFRLTGLVAITVTGIVYHVALADFFEVAGIHKFGNQLVHTVVPLLAVIGWVAFGPRRLTSVRIAWLSLLFPVCWLAFTLSRGAVTHWYPYPFLDVARLGYLRAMLNSFWMLLLLLSLAAGATVADRRLGGGVHETAPAAAARPRAKSGSPVIGVMAASAVGAAVAGSVMAVINLETPLVVSTFGLAVVIAGFLFAAIRWTHLAQKDAEDSAESQSAATLASTSDDASATRTPSAVEGSGRQLSPAMTAATSLAIQVQGVVLGLVFAFSHQDSTTVKVGAISLGLGVVVGLLLYSLAAIDISGRRTQAVAVLLFNLTLWTLAYGLLCIVAAFVTQQPATTS
jgi:hypothetical protein